MARTKSKESMELYLRDKVRQSKKRGKKENKYKYTLEKNIILLTLLY